MTERRDELLSELRRRVAGMEPWTPSTGESDALTKALHELDVYQAELEIQNQDLRETQATLGATRDRYRALFDDALVPFLVLSTAGIVVDANRAATRLFGRSQDRLIGKPLVVCLDGAAHEAFVRHLEGLKTSGASPASELSLALPNGDRRLAIFRSSYIISGTARDILCHLTDVTEQRRAEREKEELEQRLREAEKLEAVGRVAANIAHDVNNVLVSVVSLAEFIKEELGPAPLSKDIDALLDAAWRGALLMRGLLGLSRRSRRPPRVVDVAALLTRTQGMLKRKKPSVEIVVEVPPAPVRTWGDEEELLQALVNVASNGVDAMSEGRLTLRCQCAQPSGAAGPICLVQITDQGVGMSEDVRAKIFEPLFTTKAAQGGSGLGLSIVREIVAAHHGEIQVQSALGQGTTVSIELALADEVAVPKARALPQVRFARELSLVVVDDDESVLRATARALVDAGGKVSAFPDGPSAFAALMTDRRLADVAVLDVNMPAWSGPELARRLFEELGALPVVFVTGASGELIPPSVLERSNVRLVRKPWTGAELVHAISEAAGQAATGAESSVDA
jgi:two-component system, cell cycle sensor histidine kinase and response regulator CckA